LAPDGPLRVDGAAYLTPALADDAALRTKMVTAANARFRERLLSKLSRPNSRKLVTPSFSLRDCVRMLTLRIRERRDRTAALAMLSLGHIFLPLEAAAGR
jgi:hypothetical protein